MKKSGGTKMQKGMSTKNPSGHASGGQKMTKGQSIDSGATRKSTAPTPKTLGPRTA